MNKYHAGADFVYIVYCVFISEVGSVPHCGTIFRRPAEQRQELRLFASALIREKPNSSADELTPMKIFARDVQWEFLAQSLLLLISPGDSFS
ncbi:MAG: hypothetical protein AUH87_03730 [Deltaproteobacteria bacterium 13_1_40CM_4_54_4]|nr:MAG: hypothetical protein AUH87_03730 [Deltaproteobacteria bacterium 13_1_40CM_4_54_4]